MGCNLVSYFKRTEFYVWVMMGMCVACSSPSKQIARSSKIKNPFLEEPSKSMTQTPQVVLRSQQGERILELVVPAQPEQLGSLVVPFHPFSSTQDPLEKTKGQDADYSQRQISPTDVELVKSLQKINPQEKRREAIEASLNLVGRDPSATEMEQKSYLGWVDKIKQLFRVGRYEAAILEVDEMLKKYPLDPKLFEMKGTLLDKVGHADLAEKAWRQSLEFEPKNQRLRNFLAKKGVALQTNELKDEP